MQFAGPARVLDAPGMLDDVALNVLDWSARDILAVALEGTVYLWQDGQANELLSLPQAAEYVSALGWIHDGTCLAVSCSNGSVQIWDAVKGKKLRTLVGNNEIAAGRIGALAWNRHLLSTGDQSGRILTHDVRVAKHLVQDHGAVHRDEVCALKWSPDGRFLASGSLDSKIGIFAKLDHAPVLLNGHSGSTRALAWCPWQPGLLLSGCTGGDLKLWDVLQASTVSSTRDPAGILNVQWSKTHRQFLTTHSSPDNSVKLWKYPRMDLLTSYPQAHSARVLQMALSPDGRTMVTAAADECIKFWPLPTTSAVGLPGVPLAPRIMQTRAKLIARKSPFTKK